LEIIVIEHFSTGGCPLEEACEHCFLNQSAFSIAISYIISVYCEDYAGYFTVILPFLAFYFFSAYFIYLVPCRSKTIDEYERRFLELLKYVSFIKDETIKIQMYLSGFPSFISEKIQYDDPKTLEETIRRDK
jgi:hypothetical protein